MQKYGVTKIWVKIWGHPLKGPLSMKKLPRSRKKHNFSLQGFICKWSSAGGFQHLAAPDISLLRVGEFAAPVTPQDQGYRKGVL